MRRELGLDGRLVVGTVANLRATKGWPDLLEAARQVLDEVEEATFVAVGQGPMEDEIRQLHADLRLGDRFLLLGFRPDAVRVMAGCDVFCLASHHEGLPIAVMEAMALGLPIVATDVGGVSELVADRVHGRLVPPRRPDLLAGALVDLLTEEEQHASAAAAVAVEVRGAVRGPLDPAGRGDLRGAGAIVTAKSVPSVKIRSAGPADRDRILDLLSASLGWAADDRFRRYFEWKHAANPLGASPAWLAFQGDELVGYRAFLRWELEATGGSTIKAARAVDVATHPTAQRRGVFRALTAHAVDSLRADGTRVVFTTPNDKAGRGWEEAGAREIGRLPVAVRVRSPLALTRMLRSRGAADRWPLPCDGRRAGHHHDE